MSKTILFVCKHNRFRSKIAEAFFNKNNKNKNYIAESAGLLPEHYHLDKLQVNIAREFGLHLKGKPRPITTDLLKKANIFVIAANDIPHSFFQNEKQGRKEYIWNIHDAKTAKEIRTTIKNIKKHVENLLKELK